MRQTRVTQSTHAPLLRKPCISSDLLTPPKERLTNWCQMWQANTQGSRFSQLALCIQWLSRQTIKLRRENIVWVLKTCRGKRNVDLNGYMCIKCIGKEFGTLQIRRHIRSVEITIVVCTLNTGCN